MKILVVDDEQSICELIAKRIRNMNNSDIETVACAYSSEEALDAMQNEQFDVLITDICMGEIDGLELIKRVRIAFPELICVLISAYDKFEYAKTGIQLGVYDFWVKPYSLENMQSSIAKIVEYYKNTKMQKYSQLDAVLNEAVLTGSKTAESVFQQFGISIPYKNIQVFAWREKDNNQVISDVPEGIWYYHPYDRAYMLVSYKSENQQDLMCWLQSVGNELNQLIAGSIPNIDISLMYKQARQMLEYDWIWNTNKVLLCREINNQVVFGYVRQILNYAAGHDIDSVIEEIERIKQNVNEPEFCNIISELYKEKSEELMEISPYLCLGKNIIQQKSGWQNAMYQLLYEIKQARRFEMSVSKNNPVKWAKEYVASHIGEEISMAVISNELNISYQYFSKLFKEEAGMTFSEYIQETRMKEAYRMLLEGEKISVISEKIGFKNANNFTKAFKKMYGMSPTSLRNDLASAPDK